MERTEICWGKTFDEVLLNAAGGGDDGRDVFMLDKIANCFPEARGDEVGRVAEEDVGLFTSFGRAVGAHFVDQFGGTGEV